MKHLLYAIVTTGLLISAGATPWAQDGPEVPCLLCPANTVAPKPESGIWRNPEQSGTGFMLEVQHNTLGGFYYLFDEDGQATWYLISAEMELEEIPGIMGASERRWVAEAELEHLAGGACLGCPYTPPEALEPAGTIRFEFPRRNFGRFAVDGGPQQTMLPLTFGVTGSAEFPEITGYVLPDLEGPWALVLSRDGKRSLFAARLEREAFDDEPDTPVAYGLHRINTIGEPIADPPPPSRIGQMTCSGTPLSGPLCELEFTEVPVPFGQSLAVEYHMRLDNAGDARLVAEAEDGTVLEAFRLDYH